MESSLRGKPANGPIEAWTESAEKAIRELKTWAKRRVQILHHNDADGLCSGAILTKAFERKGYRVRRFCLEKPYPAVIEKVYDQVGEILIFADFAGRIAPMLSALNRGRNLTLILDHHVAQEATDSRVHNLDPDLFGLKGDRDIAAATTCYLFARALDPANQDMAHIAALGAVGDEFFVDGRLVSENRAVTLEAVRQGTIEIREHEKGEQYVMKLPRGPVACEELGLYLDTLGGVGYYQDGAEMGVRVCLEGPSAESDRMVDALRVTKRMAFEAEIERLKTGSLNRSPHIQWFHVEERFAAMGVKMIGAFCDVIKKMDFVDPRRYIAGFQAIPDHIPGFGRIEFNEVKVSMRVSSFLEEEIRAGRAMGLDLLLPDATDKLGGFSDACHSLTAATTVPVGKEEDLIGTMEKILENRET
jgi:single-stranded-DNA-specific exonuclease